tara:strand:+ start:245 stop:484 length:240 start_codon:yes stop_codon:yes gene_type:complete
MSTEDTEWKLLEKRLNQEKEWKTKNAKHNESTCPECGEELEWDSGSSMEWEEWYCAQCDQLYEVDVELVRFWDTLTAKE